MRKTKTYLFAETITTEQPTAADRHKMAENRSGSLEEIERQVCDDFAKSYEKKSDQN